MDELKSEWRMDGGGWGVETSELEGEWGVKMSELEGEWGVKMGKDGG